MCHAPGKTGIMHLGDTFNPIPDMPVLGSSNSSANKDMVAKIWTNAGTII